MTEQDPFERAVRRVEAAAERDQAERRERWRERYSSGQRKGFRIHATVYAAVQITLLVIWAMIALTSNASYPWFVFPVLGWGIGLAAHYAAVREHVRRKPR
jgi:hypothetical protein